MRSFRRIAFALGIATAVSAALLILRPAAAAPGDLDPSFGSGGTVDTPIGSSASVFDIVVQPDGKIVAAGGSAVPVGNYFESSFTLARYESNGNLDASFGSGGVVRAPSGIGYAVALQADGKIIAAGNRFLATQGNRSYMTIARYQPDGRLDLGFGDAGLVTGPEGSVSDLAIQPDGKIVAAGSSRWGLQLIRLDTDGALDSSFGSGGGVHTLHGSTASASAVAVQPDGKIIAAGVSAPGTAPPPPPPPPAPPPPPPPGPPPTPWQMMLARYNADGSLDPSFGSGGFVDTALGYSATIAALGRQPDGKLVVVGQSTERLWGRSLITLARYGTDGALDATFGSGGIVKAGLADSANALALQPDRRIIVAGTFGVARYRSDGTPDRTFGATGVAAAGFPPLTAIAVGLQQDGRIVTAGFRQSRGGFALNRYFARSPTTIAGRPSVVPYGRRSMISGVISGGAAGVRVQISRRGCYELRTRVVATVTTGPGGLWRVRVHPGSGTSFQAEIEGETSSPLYVQVRPKVTLSRVARGRFRARVLAGRSLGGAFVVVQRFSRNRWVDGRRVFLRRIAKRGSGVVSGRTFSAPNTAGRRLRILLPKSGDPGCYAAAASAPITG